MLAKAEFSELLLRGEPMILLDAVQDWTDRAITCQTSSHRRKNNPLSRPGGLAAVCAVEYALQAALVHAGLIRGGAAVAGRLAGVRDCVLNEDWLNLAPGLMTVSARLKLRTVQGMIYSFAVGPEEAPLVSGELTLSFM